MNEFIYLECLITNTRGCEIKIRMAISRSALMGLIRKISTDKNITKKTLVRYVAFSIFLYGCHGPSRALIDAV